MCVPVHNSLYFFKRHLNSSPIGKSLEATFTAEQYGGVTGWLPAHGLARREEVLTVLICIHCCRMEQKCDKVPELKQYRGWSLTRV